MKEKMTFKEAFYLMKNKGEKIKLPSWGGYWSWNEKDKTIDIHEKDGNVIKFNSEKLRTLYTIENIFRNDWTIATSDNCPILGGIAKFEELDAIRYAKRGLKIRMNWWPENVYVDKVKIIYNNRYGESSYIFTNTKDLNIKYFSYSQFLYYNKDILFDNHTTSSYWTWYEDKSNIIDNKKEDNENKSYMHQNNQFEEFLKDSEYFKVLESIYNLEKEINDKLSIDYEDDTLNQIQSNTEAKVKERGIDKVSLDEEIIMLMEETGEVAKAIREYKKCCLYEDRYKIETYKKQLEFELADVFIVLLNICIKTNINLYDAYINKEAINDQREWK